MRDWMRSRWQWFLSRNVFGSPVRTAIRFCQWTLLQWLRLWSWIQRLQLRLWRWLWSHRQIFPAVLGGLVVWLAGIAAFWNLANPDLQEQMLRKLQIAHDLAPEKDLEFTYRLMLGAWPTWIAPAILAFVAYRGETMRATCRDREKIPPDTVMVTAGRLTLYLVIMILSVTGLLPIELVMEILEKP